MNLDFASKSQTLRQSNEKRQRFSADRKSPQLASKKTEVANFVEIRKSPDPKPGNLRLMESSLKQKDPFLEARQVALRRLNRRECSTGDLAQHLKHKGFPPEIITQVIQDLVEKKYINDENYARIVIRESCMRGKGPHWIRMKLKEKGISTERATIETLITEVADTSELSLARGVISRRYPKAKEDPVIAKKAIQALLRRGFSYDVACEALRTLRGLE